MLARRLAILLLAALAAFTQAGPARADAAADLAALRVLMARIEALPGWTVKAQSTGEENGRAVARNLTVGLEDGTVSMSAPVVRLSGMTAEGFDAVEIEALEVLAPDIAFTARLVSLGDADWSSPAQKASLAALFFDGTEGALQRIALDEAANLLLSINPVVGRFTLSEGTIRDGQTPIATIGQFTSQRERNDAEAITVRSQLADVVIFSDAEIEAAPGVLSGLGEQQAKVSFDGLSSLDRKTNRFSMTAAFAAQDMGRISMDLAISGVSDDAIAAIAKAFLSRQGTDAEAAALAAALDRTQLTSLKIFYEDNSLVRGWIDAMARQQGLPVPTLAAQLATVAGDALQSIDPVLAGAVEDAVAAFLADPESIEITMQPPQPPGLGSLATGKLPQGFPALGPGIRANTERKL
jgi:hypothetical protein